jgi:hypothetical protein
MNKNPISQREKNVWTFSFLEIFSESQKLLLPLLGLKLHRQNLITQRIINFSHIFLAKQTDTWEIKSETFNFHRRASESEWLDAGGWFWRILDRRREIATASFSDSSLGSVFGFDACTCSLADISDFAKEKARESGKGLRSNSQKINQQSYNKGFCFLLFQRDLWNKRYFRLQLSYSGL